MTEVGFKCYSKLPKAHRTKDFGVINILLTFCGLREACPPKFFPRSRFRSGMLLNKLIFTRLLQTEPIVSVVPPIRVWRGLVIIDGFFFLTAPCKSKRKSLLVKHEID